MTHTKVRSRRGKLVHALVLPGERKDLAPESIPVLLCGKRVRGVLVTDDYIDCPACQEILWVGN